MKNYSARERCTVSVNMLAVQTKSGDLAEFLQYGKFYLDSASFSTDLFSNVCYYYSILLPVSLSPLRGFNGKKASNLMDTIIHSSLFM